MAKDPRFNFYVDNWIGGTEGFTLEQEGAYLALILMQSKVGRFTAEQAMDKLMQKSRGNSRGSTGLWDFLRTKFETDGKVYWSARLEKEMSKSQRHSEKQADRAKKRYSQPKLDFNTAPAGAAAYASNTGTACNGSGSSNGIGNEEREVQEGEEAEYDKLLERWTQSAIDQTDEELGIMERQDATNTGVPWPPGFDRKAAILDHRDLAHRYEWRFETQTSFRHSLLKVMRELKTKKRNGHDQSKRTAANAITEPAPGGFGNL